MKFILKKPILLFFALVFIIALPLCIFPINLFSGEIVYKTGLQELKVEAPLSLSYFFGLGFHEADMLGVDNFYITTKGWLTAAIFLVGFPFLIAYRVYLSNWKKTKHQ